MERPEIIIAGFNERMPLNILAAMKITEGMRVGLVIVDEVDGFCKPGAGPLAPPVEDPMIERMVSETDWLAREFEKRDLPILVLQESHTADHPEPPYPPHCIIGSGHELLVEKLRWIYTYGGVSVVKKGCINGVIGAINDDNTNDVFKWIKYYDLDMIIVVGICTDICVLQFVQAMLSARNRDLTPPLKDVVVYTQGCASYNLPIETAKELGLPEFLAHDQVVAHYMGLYLMQMSGAVLVNKVE